MWSNWKDCWDRIHQNLNYAILAIGRQCCNEKKCARREKRARRENCDRRAWLISALANIKIINVTYSMDNFENWLPDFFGEVSRLGIGLECLNKLMQGSDQ